MKKYAQERKDLLDEVAKLKFDLEEERIRSSGHCYNLMNGSDNEDYDDSSLYLKFTIKKSRVDICFNLCINIAEETSRLVGDYKFKWQKAEQDISTLQANVSTFYSV